MNRYPFHDKHFLLVAFITLLITLTLSLPAGGQSNSAPQSDPAIPQNVTTAQQNAPAPPQNTTATAPQTKKQLDEKKQQDESNPPVAYSWGTLSVIVVVFMVLAYLFYIQFSWSQKVERAGFLGELFQESIKDIEFKRLVSKHDEDFLEQRYHDAVRHDFAWLKENPAPKGYFRTTRRPGGTFPPGLPGGTQNPYAYRPPPAPRVGEQRKAAQLKLDEYEQGEREIKDWEQKVDDEATRRYHVDRDSAQRRAEELARSAVDIDLSVLQGKGPEFVLGFTTIVAIVFAVIALGILKAINSEQIGTLLAAIAGYVLGRAASRGATAPERAQITSQEVVQPKPTRLRKAA